MIAALITTFVVTDFHQIEEMRDAFGLVRSFLIGHTVFGVVVMFFQQQLLQLLV
jgi:RsiW-degrading membrane proteinase PrsW (M82 family)